MSQDLIRRNTALVAMSTLSTPVASLLKPDVVEGSAIFGFNGDTPDCEELIYAVDDVATRQVEQHFVHPFPIWTWAAKRVNLYDEKTDEHVPVVRITLVSKEGDTLSFVSSGIVQSLDLVRTLRGDGPYEPPLLMIVKAIQTRNGFKTFKLRPYREAKPA